MLRLIALVALVSQRAFVTLTRKLCRGEVAVKLEATGETLAPQRYRRGMARRIARDHLRRAATCFQRITVRRLFGGRRDHRYHFDRAVNRRTVALRKERPTLWAQLAKLARSRWKNRKRIALLEAELAIKPRVAALAAEVARVWSNRKRRLRLA